MRRGDGPAAEAARAPAPMAKTISPHAEAARRRLAGGRVGMEVLIALGNDDVPGRRASKHVRRRRGELDGRAILSTRRLLHAAPPARRGAFPRDSRPAPP